MNARAGLARGLLLALLVSGGLWFGALGFQYLAKLNPCEMCLWQRIPHKLVIAISLAGLVALRVRLMTTAWWLLLFIVLVFLASAGLGIAHVGVEQGWWVIETQCTASAGADLNAIFAAPVVRCDDIPWSLFGISMAGYNAIISLGAALLCALHLRIMRR